MIKIAFVVPDGTEYQVLQKELSLLLWRHPTENRHHPDSDLVDAFLCISYEYISAPNILRNCLVFTS